MSPEPNSPFRPDSSSSVCCTAPSERPPYCCTQTTRPGSMLPARVAMTSPSSGVIPIVVSTDRPSRTAHSDAPAPRWHVTIRNSASGRPRRSAAVRDAYACDRPWKPNRCTGQWSRHSLGSAYVFAAAGIVAWNAVSKQATCGTSGSSSPRFADQLHGARLVQRRERGECEQRVVPRRRRSRRVP